MYETKSEPLLPRVQFLFRLGIHALFALGIILFSLLLGVLGYHFLEILSLFTPIYHRFLHHLHLAADEEH